MFFTFFRSSAVANDASFEQNGQTDQNFQTLFFHFFLETFRSERKNETEFFVFETRRLKFFRSGTRLASFSPSLTPPLLYWVVLGPDFRSKTLENSNSGAVSQSVERPSKVQLSWCGTVGSNHVSNIFLFMPGNKVVGKFVEKNRSHAICAASAELSAWYGEKNFLPWLVFQLINLLLKTDSYLCVPK